MYPESYIKHNLPGDATPTHRLGRSALPIPVIFPGDCKVAIRNESGTLIRDSQLHHELFNSLTKLPDRICRFLAQRLNVISELFGYLKFLPLCRFIRHEDIPEADVPVQVAR